MVSTLTYVCISGKEPFRIELRMTFSIQVCYDISKTNVKNAISQD